MPQMSPMNWLSLFILFLIIFMMFNSLNYFNFMYSINFKKKKFLKNSINWKW